ncbi:hypothetical protein Glove_417g18 [Diversispora epigaea]|uniref:Uncharacterized protein n=1 Tax=Diversispora epigaea TaxID=1348612 RepID=A0A397GW63_9GLOM|nr:hypothetical protein Glove_417g18 [Diversispora epigaea]
MSLILKREEERHPHEFTSLILEREGEKHLHESTNLILERKGERVEEKGDEKQIGTLFEELKSCLKPILNNIKPNKGKDSGTWDIGTVKKPRDIQNVQY